MKKVFILLSIFFVTQVNFAHSRTLDEVNKEIQERVKSGISKFFSAYFIADEMRKDSECRGYKDIPNISINEWIDKVAASLPESEIPALKSNLNKSLEAMSNANDPNGGRAPYTTMYLPFKEALIKIILGQNKNAPGSILCEAMAQGANQMYRDSIDLMEKASLLEKRRLELRGK